jgi:O-antigen ligase
MANGIRGYRLPSKQTPHEKSVGEKPSIARRSIAPNPEQSNVTPVIETPWISHVVIERALLTMGALFLLVLPMPHSVSLRLTFLALLFVASVLYARQHNSYAFPLKAPIFIWSGLALLSLTWAVDPLYSFGEIKNEIFYPLLALFAFHAGTRTEAQWKTWMAAVFAAAVVLTLSAFLVWYRGDNISAAPYVYPGVGSYTTFVITVFPYLVVMLLALRTNWLLRVAAWLSVPLIIVAVFLTNNRSFWLALAGSMLVLLTLLAWRVASVKRRRFLVVAIATVVVSGIALIETFARRQVSLASDLRPDLWAIVWERLMHDPWTGYGFGLRSLHYAYPDLTQINPIYWHPHNLALSYGTQMGMFGIAVLALLFAWIVRDLWRLYRAADEKIARAGAAGIAMAVGVLIKNMTDIFFYRENSLLFWSLLGITLGYAAFRRQRLAAG